MAWNGSDGVTKPRKAERKPSPRRGIVAALIVCVCAALAYLAVRYIFNGEIGTLFNKRNQTGAKKIAEVQPALAQPSVAEKEKAEEPALDPNARPTKVGEVVNGYVMLPSGRIHKPTGVVTNRVADYGKSRYSIFERRSDNEIAAILMMKPGDTLVGTKRYNNWFTKQFLESLKEPIVITDEDEPWQVELKNSVMQARNELKEAYDNGEDLSEIMSESRQQLQDLAKYKQQIKQLYAQNVQECETEEHLEELQKAVNIMLEEKGCAPIDFTPLTKLNLMKGQTDE